MRRKFFILFSISLLLAILDRGGLLKGIRSPFEPYITQSKKVIYQTVSQLRLLPTVLFSYNDLVQSISESRKLISENKQMKLKITDLEEENEALRRQLGAPLPLSYKFIPANVIALSRQMELSVGSNNGVEPGMTVVDGQVLVGRILSVSEYRSKVILLTDNDIEVPAITQRGTRGMVRGQLGELISFDSVLQKDLLFLEDVVYTSGEADFPPQLLIGEVTHIDADDAAVYKKAQLLPYSDNFILKRVFIIDES